MYKNGQCLCFFQYNTFINLLLHAKGHSAEILPFLKGCVGCLLTHMVCFPRKFKCNSFFNQPVILATYMLINYVNCKIQCFSTVILISDFKVLVFVLWRFESGKGKDFYAFYVSFFSLLCIFMTSDFILVRTKDYLHCEWLLCPFI